jgi:putative transposase
MPNHFHFLIHTDKRTVAIKRIGIKEKNVLSEGIRNLLSSYTQGINKQNNFTGSLFQQNTKARAIVKGSENYDKICFHYIHQNPLTGKLVKRMGDWPYSSFGDYCALRSGTLCNKELAIQLVGLNMKTFYDDSYKMIGIDGLNNIF